MSHSVDLHSEGDLNISPRRQDWSKRNIAPQTQAALDEDSKYFLHQSLSTPCLNVLSHCEGSYIVDQSGKKLLDFHGNYIHQVGFANPKVIEAITQQMSTLSFCTRRYTNSTAIALAKKLSELSSGSLSRVLFAPGGAEAIGMALKVARMATGKFKTISMWDSFHGATLDAISIGGEAIFRNNAGPLMPGTEHVPFPYPGETPFGTSVSDNADACASYLEYVLEKEGDVGAVIAETIRSSPSIPPKEYWQRIRKACDKHGALLILDEIPHALGRTGKMFTYQHYGIEPDMVVIGKGLGGGIFPLAALIAKEELNEAIKERAIGHFTHEKSPVACAAALATIQIIEDEHLLIRTEELGKSALFQLEKLKTKYPLISDVRGLGLMLGIELRHPDTGEKAKVEADTIMYRALELGLNFKVSMGSTLTLTPPLTVTQGELETAFSIIDQCLLEVQ